MLPDPDVECGRNSTVSLLCGPERSWEREREREREREQGIKVKSSIGILYPCPAKHGIQNKDVPAPFF